MKGSNTISFLPLKNKDSGSEISFDILIDLYAFMHFQG